MAMIRNLKLKNQLVILVCIAIFMMILIQLLYYFPFYYLVQDKAANYALNTINQVSDRLEMAVSDIKKAATTAAYNNSVQNYLLTEDLMVKRELQGHIGDFLQHIVTSNSCIEDIALVYNEDDTFTAFSRFSSPDHYQVLKKAYTLSAIENGFFTPVLATYEVRGDSNFFCYIMPINNMSYGLRGTSKRLGLCIVMCSIGYFQSIVENTAITPGSQFVLVDSNGKIAVSNKKDATAYTPDFFKGIADFDMYDEVQRKMRYNNELSMITIKPNRDLSWRAVSIIPIRELTEDLKPITKRGILFGFIMIALLVFAGFIFSRSITRPIAYIVTKMSEIGDRNLKQRIKLKETNEIGIIASEINQMLDKIETMTGNIFRLHTRLYEAELSKKEAELSALQSQINPHFLYNTLECMRSIGNAYKSKEIVSISTAMARIFRYSIKGSNFTTVNHEVECIKDYLSIMSIRFGGKFTVHIEIDDSLLQLQTLKMVLQPIVENAVYHGLEPKDENGSLTIKGTVSDEKIVFEITDDGIGMEEQDVEAINRRLAADEEPKDGTIPNNRSIGLFNINNRIKLFYGSEYGIKLFSKRNQGTKVRVEMPLVKNESA